MKPIKAKPQFYSVVLQSLQEIARPMGYNLVVHGSMDRDLDLISIAWVDDPKPEIELVIELDKYLRGISYREDCAESGYMFKVLPGGRRSYVINLNRAEKWNDYTDQQYYLDISFTPQIKRDGSSVG